MGSHFTEQTRNFVKAFIKTASDNYPETIYKTYIINAPFIFRTVWAFIKAFLDERQVSKFKILGGQSDYLPKLLELMDLEDIPVQFGGKDETCDWAAEKGPWEGGWKEGGTMPTAYGPLCKAVE